MGLRGLTRRAGDASDGVRLLLRFLAGDRSTLTLPPGEGGPDGARWCEEDAPLRADVGRDEGGSGGDSGRTNGNGAMTRGLGEGFLGCSVSVLIGSFSRW